MPRDEAWRDPGTLLDIHESALLTVEFARGKDRASFEGDALTRDAVLLRILVIGEATKRLSTAFREAHPHISWKEIAGMRDRLIHGYDEWDFDRVWAVVASEVPKLLRDLEPLLPKRPGS